MDQVLLWVSNYQTFHNKISTSMYKIKLFLTKKCFFSNKKDTSIVFPVFPLALFFFLAFSIARKSEFIYLSNICLYTLTFGIVWAKITIKLIVCYFNYYSQSNIINNLIELKKYVYLNRLPTWQKEKFIFSTRVW